MSEYISDELLAKLHAFDSTTENAKRHEDDFDGFHCVKCNSYMNILSELDPTALCAECHYPIFEALVAEVLRHREDAVKRAREVAPPRQRNVRYRGGRR